MEQLKQYKNAVEHSNIVSKTDIYGIITFVNDEFCKISGYTREELIGQNHNIVRHPDVPAETFKLLWDTILQKKTFKTTAQNRAKDGSTFYVNTTISPILNDDGEILEFIAIRYDVTSNILLTEELKKTEEKLKILNATLQNRVKKQTEQLTKINKHLQRQIDLEVEKNREKDRLMFQQARFASMGEMIGNIAHQWRQPLSELGITIFTIKKACLKNDQEMLDREYQKAKNIIDKMSATIDDFRNFFNPAKKKEEFFVKEAIEEIVSMLGGMFSKMEIEVKTDIGDSIKIIGHKNEFAHVILNILNNSKDAFVLRGERRKIFIKAANKGKFIVINISDSAGGIEEAIMHKIFEPYFTTKHASSGTGLGLYMAKMIIESSMNGFISAKNQDGGVDFEIKIPNEIVSDKKQNDRQENL